MTQRNVNLDSEVDPMNSDEEDLEGEGFKGKVARTPDPWGDYIR